MKARDNPFAVERVLRVRYRPQGTSWDDLLRRLTDLRHRAAVVGPKGAGKTTLLEDLAPRLKQGGWIPHPLRLDEESPRFPSGFVESLAPTLTPRHVLLFDGAEQLGPWAWWRFRAACRGAGGLIITTHRPGRLPTLLTCRTSPDLLRQILTDLLGECPPDLDPAALLRRHRGNVREALRELYDLWAGREGMTR